MKPPFYFSDHWGSSHRRWLFLIVFLLTSTAHGASPKGVSALGFIEPENGVLQINAVSSVGSIISVLYVKEGDQVEPGQIIAIMSNHDQLQSSLNRAKAQLGIRNARLKQLLAGPRQGRVDAQKAVIDQLKAQIIIAASQCDRYRTLRKNGTVSQSASEQSCLDNNVLQPKLQAEKAKLADLLDIRAVDIEVLQSEVFDAQAAVEQAQTNLEQSLVRSPIAGQVLQVYAQAGEAVGTRGIAGIGQTQQMWARAEVYESDVDAIKIGQQAIVKADGIDTELKGEVAEIGLLVGRNRVLTLEPTATQDARVVEVKIRLDDQSSQLVAGRTNMQVTVVIKF